MYLVQINPIPGQIKKLVIKPRLWLQFTMTDKWLTPSCIGTAHYRLRFFPTITIRQEFDFLQKKARWRQISRPNPSFPSGVAADIKQYLFSWQGSWETQTVLITKFSVLSGRKGFCMATPYLIDYSCCSSSVVLPSCHTCTWSFFSVPWRIFASQNIKLWKILFG